MATDLKDIALLELAAKAAGVKYDQDKVTPHPTSGAWWGLWLTRDTEPNEFTRYHWNPLTDDRDAFRLAVALGLKIEHHDDSVVVWHDYCGTGFISYEGDADKATRRAIVLAAADIGQDMTTEPA